MPTLKPLRRWLAEWLAGPPGPDRQVRHGLLLLGLTFAMGLAGYVLLCGWSLGDALYMLIITISTVGYGEIGPHTEWDRVVSSFVILVGVASAAYTFGGLLQLMSEGQIRRIVNRQIQFHTIEGYQGHHIICGFGRMGAMICQDLHRHKIPFVLVEFDTEKVNRADGEGYLVVQGDATDEDTLTEAGISRAKSLVCVLPSDADNVFVTLTGRNMNKDLFITARAEKLATEKKLKQAGADRVVSPQVIGAARITSLLTRPTTVEILELVAGRQSVDLEMNEVRIPPKSGLSGRTLGDLDIRRRTGVIVVAIKRRDGNMIAVPDSATTVEDHDLVVILGRSENVETFRREFAG